MSLTSIQQNITGSVLLTPRKRGKTSSQYQPSIPLPSNAEIFKWVLTPEAVASCFIRDVFQMRHHHDKGEDFFWLKRVPCRSVRLLGVVVGLQVLEHRIICTIDDGTSVIDCLHRCAAPPQSPSKKRKISIVQLPKPTAYIGQRIRITGKISQFHETRQIVVDKLERCTSANEQPMHWKHVLSLHKSKYSSSEPFRIPIISSSMPETGPQAPLHSFPSTSTASSPTKSNTSSQQSPRKLRHPSRLRTRDLTAITFRIYVKHYMDNYSSVADARSDDESASYATVTPTKGSHRTTVDNERTPRPSRSIPFDISTPHLPYKIHFDPTSLKLRGFTLSFLRRVPELLEMARKVVRAEAKRRAREGKKKGGEAHKTLESTSLVTYREDQMELSARMKRLWKTTIIQLAREGSIVLWNGPVHPIDSVQRTSTICNPWRERSTSSSFDLTSSTSAIREGVSLFSAAGDHSCSEEEEGVAISDPEPDEESYVSLTPQYFAIEVEKAIKVLWKCAQHTNGTSSIKGPTKQRILSYLRRDGMWEQVGEWNVEEALEVLREEGRAWVNSHGVWDLVL
ncbi:hypothetical protein E1B28_002579 [Marasmius oreades]|uniref:CST complex subunit STN1 n=1 Tax=Marasmius oreades TaxID=181124 RepID=A0A9P7RNC2_9AGAR|nr:uncharacterized protein E1B28_002579 [Marasmius oreades]KAG7086637.1 hypothetical protein E1B28_002579 [Marasmius oreades]